MLLAIQCLISRPFSMSPGFASSPTLDSGNQSWVSLPMPSPCPSRNIYERLKSENVSVMPGLKNVYTSQV